VSKWYIVEEVNESSGEWEEYAASSDPNEAMRYLSQLEPGTGQMRCTEAPEETTP